ncbi:phosphate acetyltransferase [Tessaracoccus lapidicaptus]|uniref:Phosphate acetyltransferase n=1 Tax=Tessaracoccus lapidicaptus TaxID=1427523 RepID=A0A1C0AIQ4_9ACTN|nr:MULTISPECIES: phosphate acetyltransferase [Tessaracoccus]AQX15707.1 phosphate acetyltransferase [Tessaracoccus sp. T2.5-30]OCL31988.1 phosphate acetyltransferase [Tessaracoccus lapidicaptus]
MTKSVYIASSERQVSKSSIALGLIDLFARQVRSIAVYRPLVLNTADDAVIDALLSIKGVRQARENAVGVTYADYAADSGRAIDTIVARYSALAESHDAVVVLGSDYEDIETAMELEHNAVIAANLNAPVLYVVKAQGRTAEQVARTAESAVEAFEAKHNTVIGIIVTHAAPDQIDALREAVRGVRDVAVSVLPEDPVLTAPSVGAQFDAVGATHWLGNQDFRTHESLHTIVAGMTLPNLLTRLKREATVIVPADRLDLLPGLLMAHRSPDYGPLAALILTGGFEVPESVSKLFVDSEIDLPIAVTQGDTFPTAVALQGIRGTSTSSLRKIEASRALFQQHVDEAALLAAIDLPRTEIRTPTMFEHQIMQMARSAKQRIVLPEAADDRVLSAADVVLQRQVADIILLGDSARISRRASELGLNLAAASVVNPEDPELIEKFAAEYARLRAHKGMTLEKARETLTDLSYFATMMVHFGMADGMVSGAVNTTANTIRPSLEFIKTTPGVSVVSGSFLMAMSDRVLVYADCAVNPDPSPSQLADIAISSARTAESFGIEPRIAMLSYSTGDSGFGADVDKVREATQLVRERAPELKVEGPIQFDAAVDEVVAKKKMPGSEVAGRATVFIFPDLNTGNNTYKAVQRTSGAVAIGPVLQGLNKPVNDLSRGALVDDIVSTIVITAIQAQKH